MAKHKSPAHRAQLKGKKKRPAAPAARAMMMPEMPPADMAPTSYSTRMPPAKAPTRKPAKKRKKARRK